MNQKDKNTVLCGLVAIGSAAATYILMRDIQQEKLHDLHQKAIEDVNLRTHLINWIITERHTLTDDEFTTQLQERIDFIKQVSYDLIRSE